MIRVRVILAALVGLVLFSWQDVLLWERALDGDMRYAGVYHDGWRVMRDGLVIVGAALLWSRIAEIAFWSGTLALFSINGFVDLTYYWLQGQRVPDGLEWSCDAWHVCALPGPLHGGFEIAANVAVFMLAWGLLWIMICAKLPKRALKPVDAQTEAGL